MGGERTYEQFVSDSRIAVLECEVRQLEAENNRLGNRNEELCKSYARVVNQQNNVITMLREELELHNQAARACRRSKQG